MKQSIDYETFRAANMTWGDYMYLTDWSRKRKYEASELTIGQMMEFLTDHNIEYPEAPPDLICDALWEVVVDACKNRTEKL